MSRSKPAPPEERTIVLFRHGIAEEQSKDGNDASRRLTAEGRARMKQIAQGLAELMPKVEVIYTSPLIRAVQTAQALARVYGTKAKIVTADALAPRGTPKDFRKLLLEGDGARRAIYVGHEPNLTQIFLALLGIRRPKGSIELKKGGCYVLTLDAKGAGSLDLVLTPRALRKL